MRIKVLFALLLFPFYLSAQTQRISGRVTDLETGTPLFGVVVSVNVTADLEQASTDTNGYFFIDNVPVGKYTVGFFLTGYRIATIEQVLVTSAREVVLNQGLTESVQHLNDVVVSVKRGLHNEMALVSAKSFDVQETERYAGSRADPARMVSNYAGVQGADDSRNDIVVRGNSPQGILWRLEDIDIPNPNHFAIPGTTGGPVSLLNSKTLATSDFFTGAFPAEYGNSTAGVFDVKLRNGNKDRYEATAQFGFLGTELSAEGPISRKAGSSFLFAYRYSTLKIFEGLKIKIGTSSVPSYQDLTFRLNFPLSRKTTLSLFGIGGLSSIDLIVSQFKEPTDEIYGESDRDQYFTSNTGIAGLSLQHTANASTLIKATVVVTSNDIYAHHDKVFRDADFQVDSLKYILGYDFKTTTVSGHVFVNRKFGARHTLKAGLLADVFLLNFIDSSRQYPVTLQEWQHREDFKGNTTLIAPYAQYRYRPTDELTFTIGLHGQYLTHNQSSAIEPRAGVRYAKGNSAYSFGYGLHSQLQPLYQYFGHLPQNSGTQMHNEDIGFTKSHHFVLGYDHQFPKNFKMHLEAYYQYLFNIPVETRIGSSYSGLNQGSGFTRLFPDTLVNNGAGYNDGIELTLEKSFSRNYYWLFTASLYDSKAKGNDGVYRNTDYNGRFAFNLLAGYERKIGAKSTLILGGKITYAGGRLYSPPDVAASNAMGDFVVIDSLRNTEQFPDYFRADAKIGIRINGKRLTHEIAIDLVNVSGAKNILSLTYSPDLAAQGQYPFIKEYQLGFLPLFYYRLDIGWK